MENSVIVIGGGIAGITAAGTMSGSGLKVTLIERNNKLGGHVSEWSRLFPDRRKASEVIDYLEAGLGDTKIISGCSVNGIINNDHSFTVLTDTAGSITAEALLIATGFDLFKAAIKEEYGYNIYNNVITSAELEEMLSSGTDRNNPVRRIKRRESRKPVLLQGVLRYRSQAGHRTERDVPCLGGLLFLYGPEDVRQAF
jgi:heterodisulfide reductase subunit A